MAGRGVLVPSLGDWEYSNDRAATEGAYTQVGPSGAEACNCSTCRNYVAVGQRVLPPAFVAFLHSVGIDPMKEGEAYHLGQSALAIGTITHGHFSLHDATMSRDQIATQIVADGVGFLDDLFADRVLLWQSPDGRSGGWRVLGRDENLSPVGSENQAFTWSGAIRTR
jgi:hypothetical protein